MQAAGQNMSKMPSPIISTMLQWWISNVSRIGLLRIEKRRVQSITIKADKSTPLGSVCPDLDYVKMSIYVVVMTFSTGSISTHRNKYSELQLTFLYLAGLLKASGSAKPLCSPSVVPVVPLHQSAVLLNMNILSAVIASHKQLSLLHCAQQLFGGLRI